MNNRRGAGFAEKILCPLVSLVLCFLSLSLISVNSYAAWDPEARAIARAYQDIFPDPYAASVWQAVRVRAMPNLRGFDKVDLPAASFENGRFTASFALQKDWTGRVVKAPLLIWLAGVFESADKMGARNLASLFFNQGFHVLYLSNPFSADYIRQKPRSLPGDFLAEASAARELIGQAKRWLEGQKALGKSYVLGESYGSFLGMVMLGSDPGHEAFVDTPVTLICPPLNIFSAMNFMDRLMDEQRQNQNTLQGLYLDGIFINYIFAGSQLNLSDDAVASAPAIFAYQGINLGITSALNELAAARPDLVQLPQFPDESARTEWMLNYRFRDYLRDVNPALLHQGDQMPFEVLEWYNRIVRAGKYRNLRFLTSEDDFLNVDLKAEWAGMGDDAMLLSSGGHCGYMSTSWFQNLLKIAFK